MQFKTLISSVTLLTMISCRISNKEVFEEFTDIHIPNTTKVTNDEYQDMGPDYAKILELQLDKNSKNDLELSILKSKFFNSSIYSDKGIHEAQHLTIDSKKGLWYRTKNGYSFSGSADHMRDNVFAIVDTLAMTAKFEYSSD
jgi:hypothetical protein